MEKGFDIDEGQVHIIMQLTGIKDPEKAIEHFVTICIENFLLPEKVITVLRSDCRLQMPSEEDGIQ